MRYNADAPHGMCASHEIFFPGVALALQIDPLAESQQWD
jgi:hypothetical protein